MKSIIVLLVLVVSQGMAWAVNPALVPVCPPGKVGAYGSLSHMAKTERFDVMFFGDSITELWRLPANHRYPGGQEIWNTVFKPRKCGNFGVVGDRVQHVLWRITEGKQLDYQRLKAIVLLIGVNNFYQKQPQEPEEVAVGIRKLLTVMRQKQPDATVILMGLFPASMHGGRISRLNDLIRPWADGKTIVFMDISRHLLAEDPTMTKRLIFRDGLHLTPRGYQIWAEQLLPRLERILK